MALGLAQAGADAQSALFPQGEEAEQVLRLFWVMTIGGGAVLFIVLAAMALAVWGGAGWKRRLGGERLIIGAGLVFPAVTLSVLLGYGLWVMRAGPGAQAGEPAARIAVVGERWWWRVIYTGPDGETFEDANELRLPVGEPVVLELTTADVIHSFWVPKLAGKVDMIPGRTNELRLVVNEPGVSRGQCAEYCGGPHALMAFYVVAAPGEEHAAAIERLASDARAPATEDQRRGQEVFLGAGCAGCHTVRGTPADGVIGPDLTHVGGRLSLGAGTLGNDAEAFEEWILAHHRVKPENRMPAYDFLAEDAAAVAAYLESLK